jgi:vesicle-fusing ATPase
MKAGKKGALVSVLLHGPAGSGKTALAAKMALSSGAPLIKLVSPDKIIGFSDAQKVSYIERAFSDAYKSRQSVIVMDRIEALFSWIPIGPRFSTLLVDAVQAVLNREPPQGYSLLILSTSTNESVLNELGFYFDSRIEIPNIMQLVEVVQILREYGEFSERDANRAIQVFQQKTGRREVNVGVKPILKAVDRAKNAHEELGEDTVEAFAEELLKLVAQNLRGEDKRELLMYGMQMASQAGDNEAVRPLY